MTVRVETIADAVPGTTIGISSYAALLEPDFDQSGGSANWELLSKPGLGGRRRWRVCPAAGATPLYVKRYGRTPLRGQLDRIFRQISRRSRAAWEFLVSQRLRSGYVPAVEAVGYAEVMVGPWERRSAVVFTAAAGDAFDRVWQELVAQDAPVTRGLAAHDLAVRLGRFVAAFHQSGFCHRDLYLCHIFVTLDPAGTTPPRFTLIDLARAFRPRLRRMRWLLKDLSQLEYAAVQVGIRRTDRLRFLEAYLGLQRGAPRTRWYVRRVARKRDAIWQRERRKGRA